MLAPHCRNLAIHPAAVVHVQVRHGGVEGAVVGDCKSRGGSALGAWDGAHHRLGYSCRGAVVTQFGFGRNAVARKRREQCCFLRQDRQTGRT